MVRPAEIRVVLDTNVAVRALANMSSTSGRILRACEMRWVIPLLSSPVLAEYRNVLSRPEIVERYPQLAPRKIQIALERLIYIGDVVRNVGKPFAFPRDPKDAKFIELAIAGQATHLVSGDLDLLSLRSGNNEAARRLFRRAPKLIVLDPNTFLPFIE